MKKFTFIISILCVFSIFTSNQFIKSKMNVAAAEPQKLIVMTHDSFSVSKKILQAYEKASGQTVKFLKAGHAGAALNQAILAKNNPMADVFYGVDNTFLSRALNADIFLVYDSPELQNIYDKFKLDAKSRLLPVSYGDVSLNYDVKWFEEKKLAPPVSLNDLLKPQFKGLTVVQNPATSSPGLAFLLATVGFYGEDGYLDFWKELKGNDVLVTNGWKDAYWGQFTAASKGKRPVVVSYASSPPAEVYYAEKKPDRAPTRAVTGPGTSFRQIEFVGILKGTKRRKAAEEFIDFVLGKQFQEDIPLQMFVFPVNKGAVLPEVFVKYAKTAKEPVMIDPKRIAKKRELWIEQWTDIVLRN